MSFVHLHCHSEYSLLDGLSQIKHMISTVKSMGMGAVALTDHGVMHGIVEFYKEAKSAGIKPILGMEGYVTLGDHTQKKGKESHDNHHITLLARNYTGYQNLMKLTSIAHLEGYYYRPRVDHNLLAKYSEGIICLSGCPKGELAQAIKDDDMEKARKVIARHLEIFGSENYFLEIQRHEYNKYSNPSLDPKIKSNLDEMHRFETKYNQTLIKLSSEFGIPLTATNDAHYAQSQDAFAQDVLVCISTGKNVTDHNRLRYVDTPTFYLRPESEMRTLFPDLPQAIENTTRIAEMCDVEITLGKWFFPHFELPQGQSADEALAEMAHSRLSDRVEAVTPEITQRLDYELEVIAKKGYSPYFLIVEDFMGWAREEGIITNTRGSAAGSLVSYAVGITNVNPIAYNLPFERFLNPYRPSPPDIDFDVSDNKRDKILGYLVNKYGKDKVAQICTFGRMLARAALRDVARVLGYPYAVGDKIAKLTPLGSQGFPMTLDRALKESSELNSLYASDSDAKKIIDVAQTIEGNVRHLSVHAAGVVVAPTQLTDFTPLLLDPSSQEKTITQYEMHACEDVGLIKFDILGIRNLSILGAAVEIVEQSSSRKINLSKIPLDDRRTFDMLSRGETMGTFQLSGMGMTRYLKELKPTRVEDLMAMVALFRPGPMAVIPEYIARKQNPRLIKYLDPRMEKYLDKSYGMIVYQDDLLYTAIYLAGYTWEEADKFRKAVGKKIPEEMAKQKVKFVNGIVKNGRDQQFADELWKLFEPFQAYGFNKAHAASYGIIAYQTAYMKANFPVEFMCALLTAESSDADTVSQGVKECKNMGIIVKPPDINASFTGFTIEKDKSSLEGKAIRFGLSAIKNVGGAAVGAILSARGDRPFASLTDFCFRIEMQKANKKVLESLIKSGSMDIFGKRAALLQGIDKIRSSLDKQFKNRSTRQKNLFDDDNATTSLDDNLPQLDEFPREELLLYEKELLGFYLSEHPFARFADQVATITTHQISSITSDTAIGTPVTIGGIVSSLRVLLTKKNAQEMAFCRLEDLTGSIEVTIFPKSFEAAKKIIAKDKPLIIIGKVDSREDQISVIADKIYPAQNIHTQLQSLGESQYDITIPKNTPPQTLLEISKLLQNHRGSSRLTLIFQNNHTENKRMTIPFGVELTPALKSQINSLIGN